MDTIIPKPRWKQLPDGKYWDDSAVVLNSSSMSHAPMVFQQGVEHGAFHICKHLLELGRKSSEDMFRELIAIADGKPVTKDWDE